MKWAFPTIALVLLTAACAPRADEQGADDSRSETEAPGIMNVISRGLTFDAPDQVPSGWTTIRFTNESPMVHFVVVERLPEGVGVAAQQAEVAPVFQGGMDLLEAGDVDAALLRFGDLPPWFGEIVFFGGPGLTSPGLVSEATMHLEPGTYMLECYVKTGGIFHSYNPDPAMYGMVHEFTVTDEVTDVAEPLPDVKLEISSTGGIEIDGDVRTGEQTISVHFTDQTAYANFVGHDVHVVSLSDSLDLDELQQWLNWTMPTGLQTPAPAVFLGGINEMPAGTTGYFSVTLDPGRYAFVSEVPNAAEKGLLREFIVQ